MKKESHFRYWCQLKWNEHLEELDQWRQPRPTYDSTNYFNKYKFWLKREYKHETTRNI